MSVDFIFRLIGLFVFGLGGFYLGQTLVRAGGVALQDGVVAIVVSILVGGLVGFILMPFLTTHPYRALQRRIKQTPSTDLLAAVMGLVLGLLIAVLLDTSVIIDGRIADISRTDFLSGTLLVPRFVLNELQHIADSSDALRRNRGRRGLDILNRMQKDTARPLRITDMDVDEVREVDDKLVALAKRLKCPVLTNDYNLNRVAEIQGVTVLNVNELANAVRLVFLPGESMHIEIIQEGKEVGQGVGYLDDGTMIVVEEGRRYIGAAINVTVTKVLQTAAGRMIFARPDLTSGN